MLKGIAWLSMIALATGGALTFVPDKTWDTCPQALAPARAKLAEVGIAPAKFRAPKDEAQLVADSPRDVFEQAAERKPEFQFASDVDPATRSHVRIGDSSRPIPEPAHEPVDAHVDRPFAGVATDVPDVPDVVPTQDELPQRPSAPVTDADIFNDPQFDQPAAQPVAPTPTSDAPVAAPAPAPASNDPYADANAILGESSSPRSIDDAFPQSVPEPTNVAPMPGTFSDANANTNVNADANNGGAVAFPTIPTTPAAPVPAPTAAIPPATPQAPAAIPEQAAQTAPVAQIPAQQTPVAPVAPLAPQAPVQDPTQQTAAAPLAPQAPVQDPAQQAPADPNAPQAVFAQPQIAQQPQQQGVEQAPTALQPQAAQTADPAACLTQNVSCSALLAQGNAAGSLDAAMNSAKNIQSAEQAREVFLTLNQLRRIYLQSNQPAVVARINEALDRLAFEVFYNPQRAILEPLRQTKPGETLESIARECEVAPETLAAINDLKYPVDATLPPGTSLKVVHGPVTAEVSASRKELLLNFNNLYAGRFRCGVPQQAAGLRGEYVVERKIENPECKAVDMTGAEVMIEGGSPDNPLGSCWIGLNGGYGLQGTNRPELVGADVPENGGFVFSNLHISQLDVLLPVGSSVYFTD